MEPDFWHARWTEGRTGFHGAAVHSDLLDHAEVFLGESPQRVLVPLAGKSVDIPWLLAAGHEVTAIELVNQAVADFHQEQDIEALVQQEGPFTLYRSSGLRYYSGDIFALDPATTGPFDRVWDRAAVVALPPARRPAYAALIRSLLAPGARILQNHFEYDQERMPGPPFSVTVDELQRLYPDARIQALGRKQLSDERFRERGLEHWTEGTVLLHFP